MGYQAEESFGQEGVLWVNGILEGTRGSSSWCIRYGCRERKIWSNEIFARALGQEIMNKTNLLLIFKLWCGIRSHAYF